MGDLSTPLLDSVNGRLTAAETDCAGQALGPGQAAAVDATNEDTTTNEDATTGGTTIDGTSPSEVATSEVVGVTTAADAAAQSTTDENIATPGAIIEMPPNDMMVTPDTTPAGTTTAGMATEFGSATEEISTPSESRADGQWVIILCCTVPSLLYSDLCLFFVPVDTETVSTTATSELTTEGESIEASPWEEAMTDWATGSTASVQPLSQDQYTQYYDGRKKIKRNYIKPDRPYRPPKEAELA